MKSLPMRIVCRAGLLLVASLGGWVLAPVARAAGTTMIKKPFDATKAITRADVVGNHRISLKGWKGDLKEAQILDLAGNDVSAVLAPKTEAGTVTLAQPTRPFVIKNRVPQLVTLNEKDDTVLPGGLVVAPASGPGGGMVVHTAGAGGGGKATTIWFRLFCAISPRPAPWDPGENAYVTSMKFTVRPTDGTPASVALPSPVTVSIDFDGMTAEEVPDFAITEAGLEHQQVVKLRFRPSTLQPKLKIRSTISDSDVVLQTLPRLELRPARTTMLGLGLETLPVTIAQVQADGQPMAAPVAVPVDVEVRGSARREGESDVVIPAGEARAEFVLRSSGLGNIEILATAGGLASSTSVTQRFPVGPLVAALLGGAVGGFARRWMKGARKRSAKRRVIEGVVVGAVAFVAGVLGVGYLHLPAAVVATEAGAFLSAVLCGFVGVTVLSAITDRTKPGGD